MKTGLALSSLIVLVLLGCSRAPQPATSPTDSNHLNRNNQSIASSPSSPSDPNQPSEATNADPRTIVDRFYHEYIVREAPWQVLQAYIDPETYEQLSQVELFDADPITNAQVPVWEYAVGDVRITGDTAQVEVRLKVELRQPPPTFNRYMTVVLQNNGGRWQIKNVIYSPEPLPSGEPNDLLHIWKP